MPDYLLETYAPRPGAELLAIEARARVAAKEMRGEGIDVRYVRSIFVPEDEICFHLFQAPSADAVGEASRRAKFAYERIVDTTRANDQGWAVSSFPVEPASS